MSVTTAERDLELDAALDVFLTERTRLFRIAHRVVGDPAVAEDVVQEAWVRWQRTDRRGIKNPAAFLTTATTHLAINVVQSARHRHERPTEVPQTEVADPAPDPTMEAERAAAAAQILGSLMARLSPAELAAYVLRKAFAYPYAEVSRVLGVSTPNARQLVHRAHLRLLDSRPCRVDPDDHRRLVRAFLVAARTGALEPLEHVLVHVTDRRVTFG
jgi:RNA polymerase sigma-70 factor (ECF subfamily)